MLGIGELQNTLAVNKAEVLRQRIATVAHAVESLNQAQRIRTTPATLQPAAAKATKMAAQQPNPEAVINTLIHTFSADAATRKAAEEGIQQLTSMRGSLFLLVQVAAAPVREDARQAAAITVKNLIKRRWGEDDIFGSEPDRAQARTAVLDALMRPDVTGPVRDQLAEAVNELATRDFPER